MRSEITSKGIPSSLPFTGMQNYVYGLSDFWKAWFEDLEVIERTLEATSYQLADVYSQFIQTCSSVSLFDINETLHSSIRLILIDESDRVPGTFAPTYRLKEKVLDAGYLFDRPMASRKAYEKGVHFNLIEGGTKIEFFQELSPVLDNLGNTIKEGMGFPSRNIPKVGTPNGVTQYSIWASDTQVDEQALYEYFGKLVRISPETSTKVYKDYIQGLFFLYTNGPTIDLLSRGLHLSLGIPLAREDEEVLLVKLDDETGNYLIVTENNSYTVPYGITPSVEVGETLLTGSELASVASLVDYRVKDGWWVNLRMPAPLFPGSIYPRIASIGSFEEYAMRKYLKTHTFLVNIQLSGTLTTESAAEISRLVLDAKPTYTIPILVWSIPLETEELRDEDPLKMGKLINAFDTLINGEYITRNHLVGDIVGERSQGPWIRSNGSLSGYSGVTTNVTHTFQTSMTDTTPVVVQDINLIPLYNLDRPGLISFLISSGVILPNEPGLRILRPKSRFLISNKNLVALYNSLVVQQVPMGFSGITYNLKDIGIWQGELLRAFVPVVGLLTGSEQLAVMYACDNLYSVFLHRPAGNFMFNPVYFPPAEEDKLTITQVPA